jgi:hypothetical protein
LHERQETTALDLRHKLKLLRQEGAAKEKQLELAHRTIERLAVGNSGLEAGAASDKAYIRRLEAQVLAARGASELESRCAQLHAEAESLRCQLLAADQRATAAEEQAREKTSDVEFLRRGVELAAEQLTRSAGANVSATMLLSVVRVRPRIRNPRHSWCHDDVRCTIYKYNYALTPIACAHVRGGCRARRRRWICRSSWRPPRSRWRS